MPAEFGACGGNSSCGGVRVRRVEAPRGAARDADAARITDAARRVLSTVRSAANGEPSRRARDDVRRPPRRLLRAQLQNCATELAFVGSDHSGSPGVKTRGRV